MRRLQEPVSFDELAGLLLNDDGINYFDFVACVAELVKTEHLVLDDGMYVITEKGLRNGGSLTDKLPLSVQIHAERITAAFRGGKRREKMITTLSNGNADGSRTVYLTLSDGAGDILSMGVLAANEQQAQLLENGFRTKAESVYNTLIEMLLDID